jgi:N-acetyl-1-D-myo-inositol-2-amino-2-deoxy-alpha-D-glucopyranoside deacetylase
VRDLTRKTLNHARIPCLALATVGLMYLAWMGLDGSMVRYEKQRLPVLTADALGSRILVVSPHPDDESLGSAGLIAQSLRQGKTVMVVLVTSGDGFRRVAPRARADGGGPPPFIRLGETRTLESRAALSSLGLAAADLVCLGYPDGTMASLWDGPWDPARPSRGVNGRTAVPYSFALSPGAPYAGSSVTSDLASVVASFAPSAVIYPDAEDSNADHSAVRAFTEYALNATGFGGGRYTYLVHRGHFPFPWSYLPGGWLDPPKSLRSLGQVWLSYRLEPDVEAAKERALGCYASQRRAMEPFLDAFVRRNELFGSLPIPRPAQVETASALDATMTPGVVIRDSVGDTVIRLLSGEADLRRVAMADAGDGIWLGLETRTPPTPAITYRVHAIVFGDEGISRLELTVRGARATLETSARGSVTTSPAEVRVRAGRVWALVPSSRFAGARHCMIEAEASLGTSVVDRTAWRTVALP